jgi:dUTP pyrophosphatase
MSLLIQRLTETATLPTRAHPHDAGMDLYADLTDPVYLMPGERTLIPTGIALSLWSWTVGQIWPRSGLAVHSGIAVLAGVIDASYRGEIKVALINHGNDRVTIRARDRIAQLLVVPFRCDDLVEVDALPTSERNQQGFGSSGS